MNIHTVSVNRASQLEVGGYYLIKGTRWGFPIPPQVLYLAEKEVHPTLSGVGHVKGVLFWRMWDKMGIEEDHLISLYEINVPEHGDHDVHLERIDEMNVRGLVGSRGYRDVQMHINQKLRQIPHGKWGLGE